jgi:hypothetical protein
MRSFYLIMIFAVFGLLQAGYVHAQVLDGPPREFTPEDEIVEFDKNNTFPEVVAIFNEFAQEKEIRFIIDRTG